MKNPSRVNRARGLAWIMGRPTPNSVREADAGRGRAKNVKKGSKFKGNSRIEKTTSEITSFKKKSWTEQSVSFYVNRTAMG